MRETSPDQALQDASRDNYLPAIKFNCHHYRYHKVIVVCGSLGVSLSCKLCPVLPRWYQSSSGGSVQTGPNASNIGTMTTAMDCNPRGHYCSSGVISVAHFSEIMDPCTDILLLSPPARQIKKSNRHSTIYTPTSNNILIIQISMQEVLKSI